MPELNFKIVCVCGHDLTRSMVIEHNEIVITPCATCFIARGDKTESLEDIDLAISFLEKIKKSLGA